METIGWVALGFFGLIGFVIAVLAVGEYFAIQFQLFGAKVGKEVEVRKEHVAAKAELKKERLAKKREIDGKIADKKLEIRLEKTKAKANEKFGENIFGEEAPVKELTEGKKAKEKKEDKEEEKVDE